VKYKLGFIYQKTTFFIGKWFGNSCPANQSEFKIVLLARMKSLTKTLQMAVTPVLFPLLNIFFAFYIFCPNTTAPPTANFHLPLAKLGKNKQTQTCLNLVSFLTTALRARHSLDINEGFQ
jgi:hypothetical protein